MNLYHLRYFVTLAHWEHYTKAAAELSITQPSLSHAIASLEQELGVNLFEKEGRNIVLTKYGRMFLEDVEKSMEILDSGIKTLKSAGAGEGASSCGGREASVPWPFAGGRRRNFLRKKPGMSSMTE